MYEVFIEHLDAIYWSGYAEQLAESNPEAFTFELDQFLTLY
jgi:hypothetical protein